jgi:hypothetical protein
MSIAEFVVGAAAIAAQAVNKNQPPAKRRTIAKPDRVERPEAR